MTPEPEEPTTELVATPPEDATREDAPDDRPAIGSWWWVTARSERRDESDYDRPGRQWLACVIEVGSNYAKLSGVRLKQRVSLDEFHDRCEAEPDPRAFIDGRVDKHRGKVKALMGKIRDLCHRLGVPLRQALAASESTSTALATAHSVGDVQKYKNALVKAQEKSLPELFARVKAEHEQMATWMKAELIPIAAELSAAQGITEVIKGKIHTVELYAGLQEELVQVREGQPAGIDARVHLMQRMHYMDEECLARYEAGGMDFRDLDAFDAWLARDGNFGRILPHDRCVVAFRIRRDKKDYGDLNAFIRFRFDQQNQRTFLYIRNGQQLHRMCTAIEFGSQLFPRQEDEDLLGDQELWIKASEYDLGHHDGIITRRQRDAMINHHQARRDHLAQQLWQWHRAGKPLSKWTCVAVSEEFDGYHKPGESYEEYGRPSDWHASSPCPALEYQPLSPENIYYDDAMRRIREATLEHNRVAVIVQGLLDRSTCLHPHPPWRIWTPDGFAAGIELVYDVSRALTPGEAPDFEAYRRQLNKSLRVGCHTIGQRAAWNEHMEGLYDKSWKGEARHGRGPSKIHLVHRQKRDGSCEYRWTRQRAKAKWVDHPTKPGYLQAIHPEIEVKWLCPADRLTCVDAYTPGDFHLFYDDPRLRADYLQWAPILLACEDWHHAQRQKQDTPPEPKSAEDDKDDDEDES